MGKGSLLFSAFLISVALTVYVRIMEVYTGDPWQSAHATFCRGTDASGTMGAAWGYRNPYGQGHGENTAAQSAALVNFQLSFKACFEIKCANEWCHSGSLSIFVTANKFRYALPNDNGGQPPSAETGVKTGHLTQYWLAQSWSFTVTGNDGRTSASTSWNIVQWQFNQTFTAKIFQGWGLSVVLLLWNKVSGRLRWLYQR